MRILINLDTAHERRQRMAAQFAAHGLAFERIGFDGRGLGAAAAAQAVADVLPGLSFAPRLSGAEIGCWISHLLAWRRLLATQGQPACTVVEDDVLLQPEFEQATARLMQHEIYDVVYLGTSSRNLSTRRQTRLGPTRLHEPVGAVFHTWGYVIARRYAQWFFAQPRRLRWPIDHVLGGRVAALKPRLAVLQPAVVEEDPWSGARSQIEPSTFRLDRVALVESARRRLLASRAGDLYYKLYRFL
jgi:glycosyl transferase family 25